LLYIRLKGDKEIIIAEQEGWGRRRSQKKKLTMAD